VWGCQSCEITPFEDTSLLGDCLRLLFVSFTKCNVTPLQNPAGLQPLRGRSFAMLAQISESSQNRASPGPSCCPVPVPLQAENACIIKRTVCRPRH
jgi:hypothetical protein